MSKGLTLNCEISKLSERGKQSSPHRVAPLWCKLHGRCFRPPGPSPWKRNTLCCHLGLHCQALQYSCLENPRDGGAWSAAVYGVAQSRTRLKWLSNSSSKYLIGNGNPLQYSCLENPMDGGVWWAAVLGVAKSQTRLSDFTFTFHFHALEKEMATHSSVLAWRIPGTEQSGGLPSVGPHRVRHHWSNLAAATAAVAVITAFSLF